MTKKTEDYDFKLLAVGEGSLNDVLAYAGGQAPFPRDSLEGRLQRQLVLYDQGTKAPDPMRCNPYGCA